MLIAIVIVSGCWDRRELETIAIVAGVGIDLEEEGQQRGVVVSAQIVKPSQVKSPGASQGGGNNQKAYWVLKSTGKTIFEAIRAATLESSRRLYWAHNQVLIIGEDAAEQGIIQFLDFFIRDPEPRPTIWVLVADGKAGVILKMQSELENVQAFAIADLVENYVSTGEVFPIMLQELIERLLSKTTASLAPRIREEGKGKEKRVVIDGTAVFKRDKLIGLLSKKETRGLLWVLSKINSGIVNVKTDGEAYTSIELINANGKFNSEIRDGIVWMKVYVEADGNLGEEMGKEDFSNPENLRELEQEFTAAIRDEIIATWQQAQKMQADIYGLGEEVKRRYPKLKDNLEPNWEQMFSEARIELVVKAKIRRLGKTTKPLIIE